MSNKKDDTKEMLDILMSALNLGNTGSIFNYVINHPTNKPDHNDLGRGFRLVPDETLKDNTNQYSHLYKDGVKVSDMYFRLGGLPHRFGKNNDFCSILAYPDWDGKSGWGNHCIIDLNGVIVLMANKFDSLYYLGGAIATIKDTYYNLHTKQPIVKGSNRINSEKFYFVENQYDKEYPLGVYKIEKATGEFEIFE